MTLVFNFYKRRCKFGSILSFNTVKLNDGYNKIGDWIIDNQITKLNVPYYIILGTDTPLNDLIYKNAKSIFSNYKFSDISKYIGKIYKMTSHGYSGSPWLYRSNDNIFHIGIHIGKVLGVKVRDKKVIEIGEFAYVKPI